MKTKKNSSIKVGAKGDFRFSDVHVQFFERGTAELEKKEISNFYLENEYLTEALNFDSLKTFFIARTGVGKSAIIEKVKATCDENYLVQIDPESFMPTLLRSSTTLEALDSSGINIDYFLKTLWRFVIVVEILKRRYGADRKNFFEKIKMSDGIQKQVYNFLEKFKMLGPDNSISERVLSFVEELSKRIQLKVKIKDFEVGVSKPQFDDSEKELIKSILKDFEFTEVNQLVKNLEAYVEGESFFILIDDLDKSFVESNLGILLIKSLFLTMIDIAPLKNIRPIVSLRINLFTQIKFAQPEKQKPFIRKMTWSDNDLKNMIDRRFKFLFKLDTNYIWQNIFPEEIHFGNNEKVKIHKYLMAMSNRRPRDLFYLIGSAIEYSKGKNKITQESFKKAEATFSKDRLINFISEWESPYSGLGDLLCFFQGKKSRMTGSELRGIIDSIIVTISDSIKKGNATFLWAHKSKIVSENEETFDDPQGVFKFLYKIGILGFRDESSKIHFCFDFDPLIEECHFTDGTQIFLNPALAQALTNTNTAYSTVSDFFPN